MHPPIKAVSGLNLICLFETEEQVRAVVPDQALLGQVEGRIQNAGTCGAETGCISRSICPDFGSMDILEVFRN